MKDTRCTACGKPLSGTACTHCGAAAPRAATNPFVHAVRTLSNPFARVVLPEPETAPAPAPVPTAPTTTSASPSPARPAPLDASPRLVPESDRTSSTTQLPAAAEVTTDPQHTLKVPRIDPPSHTDVDDHPLPVDQAAPGAGEEAPDTDVVEMPFSPGTMFDELRDLAGRLEKANAPKDAALIYRVLSHLLGAR